MLISSPDSNIFCYTALADKQQGTLYTDATGALPARSMDANQYYFIAYDYDTNYIFAEPIPNVTDETIITTFQTIYNTLVDKGHKPLLNITDNQATTPLKKFLKEKKCKWQFVEPNNHRVNAAKRAIQTYKNHFVSGLASTDHDWPIQLWDTLTTQACITLNLVRTSRKHPDKSAHHSMHGEMYDWNAYLMICRPDLDIILLLCPGEPSGTHSNRTFLHAWNGTLICPDVFSMCARDST